MCNCSAYEAFSLSDKQDLTNLVKAIVDHENYTGAHIVILSDIEHGVSLAMMGLK